MASCAQQLQNEPELNISDLMIGGNFKLSDIQQKTTAKAVMNCVLSQTTINEISTKLTIAFANNIGNMISHIDKSLSDERKKR
jgi:hypothetical protein